MLETKVGVQMTSSNVFIGRWSQRPTGVLPDYLRFFCYFLKCALHLRGVVIANAVLYEIDISVGKK